MVVGNIITNLALLVLSHSYRNGQRLAISTAKTKPTRYERSAFPKNLIAQTLADMTALGLILTHSYEFKRSLTTIEPTPDFRRRLDATVALQDIGRDPGAETVKLTARTGERPWGGQPLRKALVHYQDNTQSNDLRQEMERVNSYLNQAGLTFEGEPQAPVFLHRCFLLRDPDTPTTFNLTGRLAGGFWMNLPSRERYKLRLRGEEIVDLDFSAMFAYLAYLRSGKDIPDNDPYTIPGLEHHRNGAKLTLLSLLSRANDMRRVTPELKAAIPEGWTARQLQEATTLHHPHIVHLFGTDVGVDLMFTESQILMTLLNKLAKRDIPALPMHDGIMVPMGETNAATEAMQEASLEVVGVALPIKPKAIWKPTF